MLIVWTCIMVTVITGRVNWPRVVIVIRVAMAANAIYLISVIQVRHIDEKFSLSLAPHNSVS